MDLTYLLPFRSDTGPVDEELASYLAGIAEELDVIVVDGSPPWLFAANAARLASTLHIPVADHHRCANGKVRGVLSGLERVETEHLVIADDDVRWTLGGLRLVSHLLEDADLVRPQNYFDPCPWHARWDTSRSLLNRAVGHDWPGTLAVRRSLLSSTGGYDGDVLFENLELIRTVRAAGGRVVDADDLFVRRLPPSTRQFLAQRSRQAYDDLAMPGRLMLFLALGPAAALLVSRRGLRLLAAVSALPVGVALAGLVRGRAWRVMPVGATLLAPGWVAERAAMSWVAVFTRLVRGGCRYRGVRLRRAATPMRVLRARHAGLSSGRG